MVFVKPSATLRRSRAFEILFAANLLTAAGKLPQPNLGDGCDGYQGGSPRLLLPIRWRSGCDAGRSAVDTG